MRRAFTCLHRVVPSPRPSQVYGYGDGPPVTRVGESLYSGPAASRLQAVHRLQACLRRRLAVKRRAALAFRRLAQSSPGARDALAAAAAAEASGAAAAAAAAAGVAVGRQRRPGGAPPGGESGGGTDGSNAGGAGGGVGGGASFGVCAALEPHRAMRPGGEGGGALAVTWVGGLGVKGASGDGREGSMGDAELLLLKAAQEAHAQGGEPKTSSSPPVSQPPHPITSTPHRTLSQPPSPSLCSYLSISLAARGVGVEEPLGPGQPFAVEDLLDTVALPPPPSVLLELPSGPLHCEAAFDAKAKAKTKAKTKSSTKGKPKHKSAPPGGGGGGGDEHTTGLMLVEHPATGRTVVAAPRAASHFLAPSLARDGGVASGAPDGAAADGAGGASLAQQCAAIEAVFPVAAGAELTAINGVPVRGMTHAQVQPLRQRARKNEPILSFSD